MEQSNETQTHFLLMSFIGGSPPLPPPCPSTSAPHVTPARGEAPRPSPAAVRREQLPWPQEGEESPGPTQVLVPGAVGEGGWEGWGGPRYRPEVASGS